VNEPRIQLLDELGAEFSRIEEAHRRGEPPEVPVEPLRRLRERPAVVAVLAAATLLAMSLYIVPGTRAAVEDLAASFARWFDGSDDQAPGRALRPDDDAPGWVRESGGSTRLIAEAEGVGLYATRSVSPSGETLVNFSLGKDSTVVGASVEGWRERFDRHAVVVLGPAHTADGEELDERHRFPLLGVTSRSVERVELRYATGAPLVANDLNGGFVLWADARRALTELVAYDVSGRELERITVDVQPPAP